LLFSGAYRGPNLREFLKGKAHVMSTTTLIIIVLLILLLGGGGFYWRGRG
jgi:hypothetical protein